jgi:hypothetical protein
MKAKNENIVLIRVSHRAMTRAYNKAVKNKYRYVCMVQHPVKKGTEPTFSLLATKKWWSEDLRSLLKPPER